MAQKLPKFAKYDKAIDRKTGAVVTVVDNKPDQFVRVRDGEGNIFTRFVGNLVGVLRSDWR